MTCHDAREQLSALLDDALTAPERSAVDSHLATCAECRRELERLRGTVALLGRLGPAHAPAGFVDRVMAEAGRPSRLRRLLDALFRPLRAKLPLEAAAVVLVGISALYVYQRTPEVHQLARPATPAPAPPVGAPAPPSETAGAARPAQTGELRAKVAPAEQELARQVTPPAAPPPAASPPPAPPANAVEAPGISGGAQPAPMTDSRLEAGPAAKPETKPDVKKEAQAEQRRDAFGAPAASARTDTLAKSAEPTPSRDAATARSGATPSPAESAPPAAAPAPAPGGRANAGGLGAAAPAAPAREGAPGDAAAQKSRGAAVRLMRAVDASGRLVVPASEPAEIALDALLSRLGATRVARRVERTPGPILVDVNVPAARYHELLEGLGRIGRWTIEHESKAFPSEVRLEVAIFTEP
jgi:anti-sigma factor RsiW